MSIIDLLGNKREISSLWRDIEGRALNSFLQDIEGRCVEAYEGLLGEKADSLVQKLWEIQLEQGFNTLNSAPFFYPRGTKFFYHTNQKTIVVVEQPPQVRTISYDAGRRQEKYTISLPYVIFAYYFSHNIENDVRFEDFEDDGDPLLKETRLEACHCYFANEPLKSMDTMVAFPALPNIHLNGNICWGQTDHDAKRWESSFEPTSENIISFVEDSITFFWSSWFNNDLDQHHNKNVLKTPKLAFKKWEKETDKDPSFILDVKWLDPVPFKHVLMVLPGSLEYTSETDVPPANSFAEANNQLDDVYCAMMQKSRGEVRKMVEAQYKTDEFEGLREVFHALVVNTVQKAHMQFLSSLSARIKKLPSYRREEVEKCIEESLKDAMIVVRKGRN